MERGWGGGEGGGKVESLREEEREQEKRRVEGRRKKKRKIGKNGKEWGNRGRRKGWCRRKRCEWPKKKR